jgi:hypothetical protein
VSQGHDVSKRCDVFIFNKQDCLDNPEYLNSRVTNDPWFDTRLVICTAGRSVHLHVDGNL